VGKNSQAPLSPTVVKTSSGASNLINICEVTNISNIIDILKKNQFWIYSTGFSENSSKLSKINLNKNEKIALIVGNEGDGVKKSIQKKSDVLINIDMVGKTESLNVSVATGVVLYHFYYLKNKE